MTHPYGRGFFSKSTFFCLTALLGGWLAPLTASAQSNDLCTNATVVTCGTLGLAGNNLEATSTGAPVGSCGTTPGNFGVWYRYVGTGDSVDVNTFGSPNSFDTKLNVYSGACGAFTCVGGNDDADGTLQSQVRFLSVSGTTYYFHVGGFGGDRGQFVLNVSCINDLCTSALAITCGTSGLVGTNQGATGTGSPQIGCGTTPGSFGVWYTFVSTGDSVDVNTFGSPDGFDTKLNVYSGACGTFTCVGGNDDAGGTLHSQVRFPSVSGTRYYVYVTGFGSSRGNFVLNMGCTELVSSLAPAATYRLDTYPNPARTALHVSGWLGGAAADLTLHDALGRAVRHQVVQGTQTTLAVGDLPVGLYHLTVKTDAGTYTAKVVIER